MAPFQFAMNDVYLRDTSRKVKQTLDMKRKKGKYAACPPYGYKKAERTTDQLVPDENTAPIVRQIFAWAADGLSARGIAVRLNQQGAIRRSSIVWNIGITLPRRGHPELLTTGTAPR